MRDGMRRSAGLALLLGILCAPPARSQDQPAQNQPTGNQPTPAARPWSDPPTKPVDLPGAAEPATRSAAGPVPAETPRPAAASARSASPTAGKAARPARATVRTRSAESRAVVRRKAETREAARPSRRGIAAASSSRSIASRSIASRSIAARAPAFRAPPMRVARPLPPEMRGSDVDLWVDTRADRIRRAQDGGFLVMRRTTIEDPMGRRMQILRPLDDEDE